MKSTPPIRGSGSGNVTGEALPVSKMIADVPCWLIDNFFRLGYPLPLPFCLSLII